MPFQAGAPSTFCKTFIGVLVASIALLALPVQAQVKRSFVNLSFESPNLVTAGCRVYIPQAYVPGWDTDHPNYQSENSGGCVVPPGFVANTVQGRILEIWHGPRDNNSGGAVNGRSGTQFAELNAEQFSRIFQNICLVNGESVGYRFSHRGRQSALVRDVMTMRVGTGANSSVATVSTTNTGAINPPTPIQGTITAGGTTGGWRDYTGQFSYVGPSGNTNIGFEAVSAAGGSNTSGNFLDDIQMTLAPFVEFEQPSTVTGEAATINPPRIRVNGTSLVPFTVTVQITGGTATLGTDYTTPGNSTTLTVTVPAGTYDGITASSLFSLPITVTNDALSEGDENIVLTMQPGAANSGYIVASSNTCGGSAQSGTVYQISDDDAALQVSKAVSAPIPVPGQPGVFNAVYTIDVVNPSSVSGNYLLVDTPSMDVDTQILSASSTRTTTGGGTGGGSDTPPLTGSGPWTLSGPAQRTLPAGATDHYVVTVQLRVNRGGVITNDTCQSPSVPGSGLHNSVTATLQTPAQTFSASNCQNTPTPIWVTLNKNLQGRAVPGDQIRVQVSVAGVTQEDATTTGTGPATATTGTQIHQAGDVLAFTDIVGSNGDFAFGSADAPRNYQTDIQCTNARPNSADTILPTGSGSQESRRQLWGPFSTHAGDDITCTIVNTPLGADLGITTTNTPGSGPVDLSTDTVVSGTTTTYSLVATNNGPGTSIGATVRDTPGTGLTCPAGNVVTCSGPAGACPTSPNPITVAALSSGVVLGTLPATAGSNAVTMTFSCTVQ